MALHPPAPVEPTPSPAVDLGVPGPTLGATDVVITAGGLVGRFGRGRDPRQELGARRRSLVEVPSFDKVVFVVVGLVILTAIFGPIIAPASVYHSDILNSLAHPSTSHWLGTDDQGRDVLWRVVAGARYSVLSAVLAVSGFSLIGVLVATIASVGGRRVDEIVMRMTDAALSIPPIILALGLAAALGPSLRSAVIALIATGWPFTARLLRTIMRETMALPFVEGARVLGVSKTRLMLRHVLPNSLDVLIVKWAGDVGTTILILGALSFVGVGAQPPSPEWGAMVTSEAAFISTAWWAALAPGIAIAITATSFGLLGDILQVRQNPEIRRNRRARPAPEATGRARPAPEATGRAR